MKTYTAISAGTLPHVLSEMEYDRLPYHRKCLYSVAPRTDEPQVCVTDDDACFTYNHNDYSSINTSLIEDTFDSSNSSSNDSSFDFGGGDTDGAGSGGDW